MTDRVAALPPDEKCCAETLAQHGFPQLVQAFAIHANQHGLTCERYATLWMQELLVQAALGFRAAAREAAFVQGCTIENFELHARRAWHEAEERRKAGGMHG